MYIHRMIVRGFRNLPDQDFTLWDDWNERPIAKVLITGPNGSGKTSILRMIAALWEKFSDWLEFKRATPQEARYRILTEADLVAIELRGFGDEGHRIWLYCAGKRSYYEQLKAAIDEPSAVLLGETRGQKGAPKLDKPNPFPDWLNTLTSDKQRAQLGVTNGSGKIKLPNVIFLDADNRDIKAVNARAKRLIYPEQLYRWLVTYTVDERWEGHPEAMFANLKLRDPEWFRDTVVQINQFFTDGKHIDDFDDDLRLRLVFGNQRRNTRDAHYIEDLSSGEQQVVLLTLMVSRWLQPGGIVLIDEPDLHLHISLQRHFIYTMGQFVASRDGQMIVTSHSETMWEEFLEPQRIRLWEGEKLHVNN